MIITNANFFLHILEKKPKKTFKLFFDILFNLPLKINHLIKFI